MNRMIGVGEDFDLLDDRLEPVLELALHARPGLQQAQVERVDGRVLQAAAARRRRR